MTQSRKGDPIGANERILSLILSMVLFAAPIVCFYVFWVFGPSFWVARLVVALILLAMVKSFWGLASVAFVNFITGTKGRNKGAA